MPESDSPLDPIPLPPPAPALTFADLPASVDVALRHVTADTGVVAHAAHTIADEWRQTMRTVRTCALLLTSVFAACAVVLTVLR